MNEITTRADIMQLVSSFYSRIRKHETFGPIFNIMLPQMQFGRSIWRLMDTTFHKIIFMNGLFFGIRILTVNFSVKKPN